MTDKLLFHYNKELQIIRRMVGEFASDHPKEAANLRISQEAFDDPHILRLIEGIAFLNARTAYKLDDEFPELVDTLLNVIYPHYLSPIPSFSIVAFKPNADLTEPYLVPKGTEIESESIEEKICRFQTCYPTTVYPISLVKAEFLPLPFTAAGVISQPNTKSILHLQFQTSAEDLTFSKLQPPSLSFYLNGLMARMLPLYELILNNLISISIANDVSDKDPLEIDRECLKPIGFDENEGILNYSSRSLIAYRLLTEYFVFPNKFMFFDIDLLSTVRKKIGPRFSLYLSFDKRDVHLEKTTNKDNFLMYCTPMTNLFKQRAEPIQFKNESLEYRVVPDARQQNDTVIHEILSVHAVDQNGQKQEVKPFYLRKHQKSDHMNLFWTATQKDSLRRKRTLDTYISITGDHKLLQEGELVLSFDVLCSNGDLPSRLPYGGGHPKLKLSRGSGPISDISCITPPTNIVYSDDRRGHNWKLLSHLSLNHLSLTGSEGVEAFKEILRLYNFENDLEINRVIDGIVDIKTHKSTCRAPRYEDDPTWVDAMCRGFDINIEFDELYYAGSSFFLFASVIERFLSVYSSINSFTRMSASQRSKIGALKKWPPRVGLRRTL